MSKVEEIGRLEFTASEVKVPPISPADWHKRSSREFTNYHYLAAILNLDSTELVQLIAASEDFETWQHLYEVFDELSDRMKAFHEMFESGSARLMIALAHVAQAQEESRLA